MKKMYLSSPLCDYDQIEKDASAVIAKVAKKTGVEAVKEIAEREDPKKKHQKRVNQRVVRQIVDSCMDKYESGDYTYKVAIEEICEALKSLV